MPPAELTQIDDLRALFLSDVPLLDVRAPVEFAEGAFPGAENHPLIDDRERHQIGLTYRDHGQDHAIELGEKLVSGERKKQRIARWRAFLERHPDAVLYCFRGGMRSRISQQWLHDEAGIDCPRVRGGYKAMRRFLLDELAENSAACQPVVIGGRTGVGKTRLLTRCMPHIDLEGLAHHRGSAFGGHAAPQPTQVDFENALSIALLKQIDAGNRPFVIEDESRNIGSRHIPEVFFHRMESAPLVLLEASDRERIEITLQEYVTDALAEFELLSGADSGFRLWADDLLNSLDRIRRRLGGDRHARARRIMQDAIAQQAAGGGIDAHRDWIALLLHDYYDGMYEYQLRNKAERIVFSGTQAALIEYLREHYAIGTAR